MDKKPAKLDAALLNQIRALVNDGPIATFPDESFFPFIALARKRAEAELPFRVAAMFLMSRGDTGWRDPLFAFGAIFEMPDFQLGEKSADVDASALSGRDGLPIQAMHIPDRNYESAKLNMSWLPLRETLELVQINGEMYRQVFPRSTGGE